ncbi:MAG TPA: DUF4340 domain-containing protein [Planctomycetota bacterium]|nr:DUF4340 domain-containing protein [Planctomycetota bacterium]
MTRANAILLAVFGALVALLVVLEKPWAADRFEAARGRAETLVFPAFEPAKAASIEIHSKDGAVRLKRGAAGWTVPDLFDYRANEEAIARLLDRVHTMRRADLATKDRARHDAYLVTETSAPRVTIRDAGERAIADFFQGRLWFDPEKAKGGKVGSLDVYVRPADSDEVYRVSPFDPVPTKTSEWIPRQLFRFDVTAVQTLVVSGKEVPEPIPLSRQPDGSWTIELGADRHEPANREACEALARSLSSVFLDEIVGRYDRAEAAKWGLDADPPRLHALATLSGGGQAELLVGGDAGQGKAYALGGQSKDFVATVHVSSLESLKPPRAKLVAPPPASAPASVPASGPGGLTRPPDENGVDK